MKSYRDMTDSGLHNIMINRAGNGSLVELFLEPDAANVFENMKAMVRRVVYKLEILCVI